MRVNEMVAASGRRRRQAVRRRPRGLEEPKREIIEAVSEEFRARPTCQLEQVTGQPVPPIEVDRDCHRATRHRTPREVLDVVEALGGASRSAECWKGERRFPITGCARRAAIPEAVGQRCRTEGSGRPGRMIPLSQLTDIVVEDRREISASEHPAPHRRSRRTCAAATSAASSPTSSRPRRRRCNLPAGLLRAVRRAVREPRSARRARLLIVVPLALLLIFALLYTTFGAVPAGAVDLLQRAVRGHGGVVALLLRGMPFSISAAVGFIALFGVAVLERRRHGLLLHRAARQGMAVDEAVTDAARNAACGPC